MTGTTTSKGLADYEQTRQRILREYDELRSVRLRLATERTRFEEVCKRVPAEYQPDPGLLTRITEVGNKIVEKVEGLLSDIAFPWYAFQDSVRWTDINHSAQRLSNMLTTMGQHGNDAETWRTGVRMDLAPGNAYPNRGGPQFPWSGIAGDNYRSQLPAQIRAADRLALLAIRMAGATNSAAVNIAFLYLATLVLIVAAIAAIKVIIGLLAALGSALWWLAGALAGGAFLFIGTTFLRQGYALLASLAVKIWSAFSSWVVNWVATKFALDQQKALIANMLQEETPGDAGQTPAFRPNGKWPNPTNDEEFPRVLQDGNGRWQVGTLREFRSP